MILPLQRTLEHLRAELSTRLGFGLQTLTAAHKNILTSFLTSTQKKLYRLMDDEALRVVDLSLSTAYLQGADIEFTPGTPGVPATITSTTTDLSAHGPGIVRVRSASGLNDGDYRVSQAAANTLTLWSGEMLVPETPAAAGTVTLYLYGFPWPNWLDPAELLLRGGQEAIAARIDDNGPWLPLEHGVTVHHESDIDLDQVGYPLAWDVYGRTPGQVSFLRVWPLPDDAYPLRIAARRRLNAFRGDLSAWAPNTAYALGAIVVPRSAPAWPLPLRDVDSFYYVCVDPGTSHGTTEPTWPTEEGAQVIDNPAGAAVVWEAVRNDCTLDQDLVLLGALALAKAHFRQADAQVAAQDFLEARRSLTGQAHGERTYSRTASRSTARRPLGQGGRIIGLGIGLAPDD